MRNRHCCFSLPPTVASEMPDRDGSWRYVGHGVSEEGARTLVFEAEDGGRRDVDASELGIQVGSGAYLVNLNACESAAPDAADLSNAAMSLVQGGVP